MPAAVPIFSEALRLPALLALLRIEALFVRAVFELDYCKLCYYIYKVCEASSNFSIDLLLLRFALTGSG
jgi:hypothetical protein